MSLGLAASAFALIFVAELPGKTTLASFLLAARSRPLPVFAGAAGAFLIHTAIAVALGRLLSGLPQRALGAGAGALFLLIAFWLWRESRGGDNKRHAAPPAQGRVAAAAFGVAFVGQWGDPSQLATAAFAGRHPEAPLAVFAGAALGLWAVTGLAVLLGHHGGRRLPEAALHKGAAAVFAAIGTTLLIHAALG